MNIIFLTISRITDINNRGIYTDLMRKFRDKGHNVYIVSPRERKFKQKTLLTKQDGINILGVKTLNIQKTNFIEKGLATLLIENQFKKAIQKHLKGIKFDLILYSTPPITLTKTIKHLKKENKAITYLLLKDIFPQNAVDLNIFSQRSLMYKLFRKKEKQLYTISDYIGCMSPANVDFLLKHNTEIHKAKVEINPNSIEPEHPTEVNQNLIRTKYNLPLDKPILIYGGNLGKPQGIDFLIEVLNTHKNRKDCHFLVIGTGTEFPKIQQWFKENQPQAATLMEGLPKYEYDKLVKSCDIGLIFLDKRFTIPNYPSRLLSYLENKMPILAATDPHTDIGKLAEENNYGYWCKSGDIRSFNEKLQKILVSSTSIKEMGENGYKYLQTHYTVEHSYNIIINHFFK